MEWVEVRGETLEAAKEEALDQLGVAHDDAEFEIVQEPESRWLGFKKTEARVRARVRPTQPRPKRESRGRRQRNRRSGQGTRGDRQQRGSRQQRDGSGGQASRGGGKSRKDGGATKEAAGGAKKQGGGRGRDRGQSRSGGTDGRGGNGRGGQAAGSRRKQNQDRPPRADRGAPGGRAQEPTKKEATVSEQSGGNDVVPVDEQQTMVTEFLQGIVDGFGLDATITSSVEDDDVIVGAIDGTDLGLLIGPRGGTMRAIQELSRSAVQRRADGRETGRLMVDVAGYRQRRRAALIEFAHRQAQEVKEAGTQLALEPMSSADRKAIHDAVMEIEGVHSVSEGDDPHRRVVLRPDSD